MRRGLGICEEQLEPPPPDSGQGHVHIARNPSPGVNTELWVTYFDVPPGGAFRINADDPGNCAF